VVTFSDINKRIGDCACPQSLVVLQTQITHVSNLPQLRKFWEHIVCTPSVAIDKTTYRRTSISGTTFSGKKCISGTNFHAI
jgi:hypothetical protein